jgi:hypothetical protein
MHRVSLICSILRTLGVRKQAVNSSVSLHINHLLSLDLLQDAYRIKLMVFDVIEARRAGVVRHSSSIQLRQTEVRCNRAAHDVCSAGSEKSRVFPF